MTPEQQRVLDWFLGGKSIFFIGSAGTGKSNLLKRIVAALSPDVITATANTGISASQIGGITLHQFARIGLETADLDSWYIVSHGII